MLGSPLSAEGKRKPKKAKYRELAADLAKQHQGYLVNVVPVVIGDLGLIEGLAGQWTLLTLATALLPLRGPSVNIPQKEA